MYEPGQTFFITFPGLEGHELALLQGPTKLAHSLEVSPWESAFDRRDSEGRRERPAFPAAEKLVPFFLSEPTTCRSLAQGCKSRVVLMGGSFLNQPVLILKFGHKWGILFK